MPAILGGTLQRPRCSSHTFMCQARHVEQRLTHTKPCTLSQVGSWAAGSHRTSAVSVSDPVSQHNKDSDRAHCDPLSSPVSSPGTAARWVVDNRLLSALLPWHIPRYCARSRIVACATIVFPRDPGFKSTGRSLWIETRWHTSKSRHY